MTRPLSRLAALCFGLFVLQAEARVEVEAVQHPTIGRMLVAKVSEEIAPGDYDALMKGCWATPATSRARC